MGLKTKSFENIKLKDFGIAKPTKEAPPEAEETDETKVEVKKRQMDRLLLHRAASERMLDDKLDWHFEKGYEYHCISQGDIDSLSYLRFILKQQKINYCFLSTWVMAAADVEEIDDWLTRGYIKKLDVYVGEIFRNNIVYGQLEEVLRRHKYGRIKVFRNHSKVMVGYGERFDFVIESSANINTNPRTEQTTVFVSRELADFYKEYFDGISPFNAW